MFVKGKLWKMVVKSGKHVYGGILEKPEEPPALKGEYIRSK
jgi:hypothetical protein